MRPLLEQRLDQVSRSFALCIPQLAQPFRDQVALAYLLFRVLDTVEDAAFADPRVQQMQFATLRSFLRTQPSQEAVARFGSAFPRSLTEAELSLLADAHVLFEDAYALPGPVRSVIFSAMERMALGMAAYARRPMPLRLLDLDDVNRYCSFVAGVVGEMLTDLWAIGRRERPPKMLLAYQFGMFLQKVNILKDQEEDETAGRFLVPNRTQLLASLRGDAIGAFTYLQSLPASERGYRTFCAWSLMLGLVTISQLDQPKESRRGQTQALLARTAAIATDNIALAAQFAELMPAFPPLAPERSRGKPETTIWFLDTLAAPLSHRELTTLGITVSDAALRSRAS